jgi:hypothetical protein
MSATKKESKIIEISALSSIKLEYIPNTHQAVKIDDISYGWKGGDENVRKQAEDMLQFLEHNTSLTFIKQFKEAISNKEY